jgi:hypothetical protein
MAIVITNAGKQKALEYFVGKDTTTEYLILKLYSNDLSPAIANTVDLYTEVTGGGYASKTLVPTSWSITSGVAEYPQQVWTFTGAASTVYGYYAVSATSNELMFAERFSSGPYSVTTDGDIIRVTLNLSLI